MVALHCSREYLAAFWTREILQPGHVNLQSMNIQRCFCCKLLVTVRTFLHQRGNAEDGLLPRLAAHFVWQSDLKPGQVSAGKVRQGCLTWWTELRWCL